VWSGVYILRCRCTALVTAPARDAEAFHAKRISERRQREAEERARIEEERRREQAEAEKQAQPGQESQQLQQHPESKEEEGTQDTAKALPSTQGANAAVMGTEPPPAQQKAPENAPALTEGLVPAAPAPVVTAPPQPASSDSAGSLTDEPLTAPTETAQPAKLAITGAFVEMIDPVASMGRPCAESAAETRPQPVDVKHVIMGADYVANHGLLPEISTPLRPCWVSVYAFPHAARLTLESCYVSGQRVTHDRHSRPPAYLHDPGTAAFPACCLCPCLCLCLCPCPCGRCCNL